MLRALLPLGAVCLLVGCGGSSTDTGVPTTTPSSTASSTTASTTAEPSSVAPTGDALVVAIRKTCEAGEAYTNALTAFIEQGPGGDVADELAPMNTALTDLAAALKAEGQRPGVKDLKSAVSDYQMANLGYTVLYTEGETAYQAEKSNGHDGDALTAAAEESWKAGSAKIFDARAPTAPSDQMRASC
jgi:hypothetical protein